MAIRFNQGATNEIVVTKATAAYCGDVNAPYRHYYGWLNETLQPFNLKPFIQAFVADNTNNTTVLFKGNPSLPLPDTYKLVISQLNDIISVTFYINNSASTLIYSTPVTGANNDAYIYFIWSFLPSTTTDEARIMIVYQDVDGINTKIAKNDEDRDAVIFDSTSRIAITTLTPTEYTLYPPLPDWRSLTTTSAYYNLVPKRGFELQMNLFGGRMIAILTLVSNLVGDDGIAPDPVTPEPPEPTPEEPFTPSDPTPYPVTPPTPDSSDVINIPGNPLIGVTSAGFINVYNPAMGDLTGLGDILFPQLGIPSDVTDAVTMLFNVIANQNLINYVIDCHVIPVTPQIGSNANIKVGYRDTGISVPVVTNDYIDATCGSLNIPEYFHGYQDYASTRSKLYLPFIGFVDTKPEYWQAGTISVDYKFNVIDGSFMCYIRSVSSKSALNGSVIAQYSGNACSHFPLTGVNYANMVSGIVGAAAGAITGGTASAVLGGAWSAANTVAQGGNIQQSNAYNSTAALMGVREAFLLIERPVPAFPAYYGHDKGYPSNITTALSGVSGFTTIEDIDLTGIPLTQTELDELRSLLKEGVYF